MIAVIFENLGPLITIWTKFYLLSWVLKFGRVFMLLQLIDRCSTARKIIIPLFKNWQFWFYFNILHHLKNLHPGLSNHNFFSFFFHFSSLVVALDKSQMSTLTKLGHLCSESSPKAFYFSLISFPWKQTGSLDRKNVTSTKSSVWKWFRNSVAKIFRLQVSGDLCYIYAVRCGQCELRKDEFALEMMYLFHTTFAQTTVRVYRCNEFIYYPALYARNICRNICGNTHKKLFDVFVSKIKNKNQDCILILLCSGRFQMKIFDNVFQKCWLFFTALFFSLNSLLIWTFYNYYQLNNNNNLYFQNHEWRTKRGYRRWRSYLFFCLWFCWLNDLISVTIH